MVRRRRWGRLVASGLGLTLLLASVDVALDDESRCDPLARLPAAAVQHVDGERAATAAPEAPTPEPGGTDCRCLCDCGCPGAVPALPASTTWRTSVEDVSMPPVAAPIARSDRAASAPPFRPA